LQRLPSTRVFKRGSLRVLPVESENLTNSAR